METVLELRNVSVFFPTETDWVHAVDNVSLEVKDGEFITIVGPSGCGKSTLLNVVSGLLPPASGTLHYRGRELRGVNPGVGYITQKDNLFPWRSLQENVELGLELRRMPARERREKAHALIHKVGLDGFERQYPHQLSGGMRQRGNLIRTLAYDPEVILLDEPFGPLDALTRTLLQNQLLSLWEETRKTILFVTHDLVEAIGLADRVLVMTARPGHIKLLETVHLPRPRDMRRIAAMPGFQPLFDKIAEAVYGEMRS